MSGINCITFHGRCISHFSRLEPSHTLLDNVDVFCHSNAFDNRRAFPAPDYTSSFFLQCRQHVPPQQLHSKPSQQIYDDLVDAVTKSTSKRAEMMLMDIFVIALEYIKSVALRRMTLTHPVSADDVTWVLTVPVCCSEPAKHFMREAATKAGFIKGGSDDEDLVLCMEPIAACLALGDRLQWRMGDRYLVIDCGGGTVDISAFEVISSAPPSLEQLGEASGGPWGSTNVDRQFEAYLKASGDFVLSVAQEAGARALESFFASSASYRINQAWERAKIGLRSLDHDCRIDLSELSREPLEVTKDEMDEGRRLKNIGGTEFVGGHGTFELVLRPALLRKFFNNQCENISGAVSEQLERPHLQGLSAVVMVGGFSGSVHVQEAVRACVARRYPDGSVQVSIPKSPDLAIVEGAAHFVSAPLPSGAVGLDGQQLPAAPRFAAVTSANSYGIVVSETGGGVVPAFFDPFFLKGQGYEMNHTVTKNYVIQNDIPFTLSVSSCASPHVHPGCNRLADIGGLTSLQRQEFSVPPPPQVVDVGCCGMKKPNARTEPGKTEINVEFSLIGIELHARVKSDTGQVMLQQAVPFLRHEGGPPPYASF
ncbi:unnamed protein product [Ectocarpus sp. CCAP 1310/34]|nr:unnamed protein product [Ectocarpus sp. CCAP 1310/34]